MKKIILFMVFLLVSCSNKETDKSLKINNSIDSTIIKSVNNIKISDTIQRKCDSITEEKVVKVITDIKYLTNTVEKLKIEKSQLTKELKISKQNVRIDTVFVETRKSFWGKEKKTITTKSGTQDVETIDSSSTKVLDTITKN
jgi:phage terminase small subunit